MEDPSLTTVPVEVLSQVTEFLSPRSIRALEKTSKALRGRAGTQPRVLTSSPENPVTFSDVRELPNVREVRGPILIPYLDNEVAFLSRRLVGDLEIIQQKPFFVRDILSLLLVRGLLYPGSLTQVVLTKPGYEQLVFLYHKGFLRISLLEDELYDNLRSLIRFLPITSFQMTDYTTSSESFYNGLEMLEGNSIRELVLDRILKEVVDPTTFPHLETLRFVGKKPPEPHSIFFDTVSTVTRIVGAQIVDNLFSHGNGYILTLSSKARELRDVFPNLQEGDITILIHVTSDNYPPLNPAARVLIRSELQEFRRIFPRIQVRVLLKGLGSVTEWDE